MKLTGSALKEVHENRELDGEVNGRDA